MNFIETMIARGFLKDASFNPKDIKGKELRAYIGFDLTAPSLHVGSLIQLMVLRWLKKTGHEPVVLLGEATTRIGDPSGKDSARKMLSGEEIEQNRIGILKVIEQVVGPCQVVSNAEWFNDEGPSFMQFLTEFGPNFTINRMLTFDSVKTRLERQQPLTLLEFSYMLLQSVDFLELSRRGVNMQIGGSDQWGNITNGLELIRKKDQTEVFAMTTPLLLDSSGNKMGKSQGTPIWLDPDMTTPFDFFQFWRNVHDDDVVRFLKLFTEQSVDWCEWIHSDIFDITTQDINKAKKDLAFLVTEIVHGTDTAKIVWEQSAAIFDRGENVASMTLAVNSGSSIIGIMKAAGFVNSNSEAKRLISQSGVSVDGRVIGNDFVPDVDFVLKVGKKKSAKITINV
jgi:tyrosyl-tRNA synthetase